MLLLFVDPLGARESAFFLDSLLFGNNYIFLQLSKVGILLVLDLAKRVSNNFIFTLYNHSKVLHLALSSFIRTFPWVIEIFDISPYCFLKIIEVFIKAEDGLSRDVVKHLNHVSFK